MASFRLGDDVLISVAPDLVVTYLPGERQVYGEAHDTAEYLATTRALGYGADVARQNRDHEITHSLLAYWLGLASSPVFQRVSAGLNDPTMTTELEEDAVMAIQRFAKHMGVDLGEVLIHFAMR